MNTPIKSKDLPVTQEMLYGVRNELKSDIASLEAKMDKRFKEQDSKFSGLESKFSGLESRFSGLEAKFEKVISIVERTYTLVEEQNQRNKYVLDGYAVLNARVEKLEQGNI